MNDLPDKELNDRELNEKSDVFIEGRDLDKNRRECFAARQIYRFFDHAFDDVHCLAPPFEILKPFDLDRYSHQGFPSP
jgi:hypothetical protein